MQFGGYIFVYFVIKNKLLFCTALIMLLVCGNGILVAADMSEDIYKDPDFTVSKSAVTIGLKTCGQNIASDIKNTQHNKWLKANDITEIDKKLTRRIACSQRLSKYFSDINHIKYLEHKRLKKTEDNDTRNTTYRFKTNYNIKKAWKIHNLTVEKEYKTRSKRPLQWI